MKIVTLGEICSRVDYGLTASATFEGNGPRFLRITDIDHSHITWSDVPRCEASPIESEKYALATGDVVVARTGASTGRSVWVRVEEPAVFASYLVRFRGSPSIDSRYLGFVLRSRPWKEFVSGRAHGKSAQPNMSASDMASFRFPLPFISEQRAIAEVLGALDDKIAANRRSLDLIAELSDAQYRAALNTEKFIVPLGEVVEFHNRRRIPLSSRERESRPGNVPYYGAAGRVGFVDESIFDDRLVLMGEDGSVMREDGRPIVQYIWGPAWVNNHAHVLTGRGVSTELLAIALRFTTVAHLVTGAVQPKLSMGRLKTLSLEIPKQLDALDVAVRERFALHRAIHDETGRLTQARDELLPLLMSGRIRVRDAEKVVEEVT